MQPFLKIVLYVFGFIILIPVAFILLVGLYTGIWFAPPSDEHFINKLNTHKSEYLQLVQMLNEDEALEIITPTRFRPDGAISEQRFEQYQQLLELLAIKSRVMHSSSYEQVYFNHTNRGAPLFSSPNKGLVYRPIDPTPLYPSLDNVPEEYDVDVEAWSAFRQIDDNWYIHYYQY